jgi:hypothetical protein
VSVMRIHYAKCWPCTFAEDESQHLTELHTWMDDEDCEAAKKPIPETPEDWAALAKSHPCSCWCQGRKSVVEVVL